MPYDWNAFDDASSTGTFLQRNLRWLNSADFDLSSLHRSLMSLHQNTRTLFWTVWTLRNIAEHNPYAAPVATEERWCMKQCERRALRGNAPRCQVAFFEFSLALEVFPMYLFLKTCVWISVRSKLPQLPILARKTSRTSGMYLSSLLSLSISDSVAM